MFKRNIFKILAIVFFLLSGATLYNSNKNKPIQQIKPIKPTSIPNTGLINQTPTPIEPTLFITKGLGNPTPIEHVLSIQPTTGSTNSTDSTNPTNPPPTSVPQGLMVSLNINGSSVGSINVTNGSNQCDVLSQALSQGKIQNLNMRYNSDMGTNAVYQINGLGKENAVWWVFKINGQSPSQGCSYIKVNSGDNILWEYLGN